ncbi:hypothetical protein EST38_g12863 [Candolleomyces aberdarensis]|uniref:Endo-1,4-beta-xylanase n=1 Tax=Candolleomyces aberdarensis TaxID=2316362 RepID=A0A4Q2D3N6_9AGAR|nr:hypothetical protein EST38_g12863 [Candolleomyces aberdarensis]
MVVFNSLLSVAVFSVLGALAVPHVGTNLTTRAGTPSSKGIHDGFFYSWWTDGGATATYTNEPKGQFSVTWEYGSGGNLLGGKGWSPGSHTRVMSYTGTYQPSGNSYLAVWGWTRDPVIEYYIIESFGSYNPSSFLMKKGTVTADGSVYDMGVYFRSNEVSSSTQFYSVRRNKRTKGTVDLGAHFRAWEAAGMRLGASHDFQILVCEGYFSSGSCNMTVSEVGSTDTAATTLEANRDAVDPIPAANLEGPAR